MRGLTEERTYRLRTTTQMGVLADLDRGQQSEMIEKAKSLFEDHPITMQKIEVVREKNGQTVWQRSR